MSLDFYTLSIIDKMRKQLEELAKDKKLDIFDVRECYLRHLSWIFDILLEMGVVDHTKYQRPLWSRIVSTGRLSFIPWRKSPC